MSVDFEDCFHEFPQIIAEAMRDAAFRLWKNSSYTDNSLGKTDCCAIVIYNFNEMRDDFIAKLANEE